MHIYDISVPISESLPLWPGDPLLRIPQPSHLGKGDGVTLTRLDMGAHTGTHVDAPSHFFPGGATMDEVDLDLLVGQALVVHVPDADALSAAVFEELSIPSGSERILFRTRNSDLWARGERDFQEDFVAISEDGARWLVEHGVRLVGVDYLSVGAFSDPVGTHEILLGAGVLAVEGLDLSGVEAGTYQLVCLPLRIQGSEAAPARAILIA
jgi:arylformamidase